MGGGDKVTLGAKGLDKMIENGVSEGAELAISMVILIENIGGN